MPPSIIPACKSFSVMMQSTETKSLNSPGNLRRRGVSKSWPRQLGGSLAVISVSSRKGRRIWLICLSHMGHTFGFSSSCIDSSLSDSWATILSISVAASKQTLRTSLGGPVNMREGSHVQTVDYAEQATSKSISQKLSSLSAGTFAEARCFGGGLGATM